MAHQLPDLPYDFNALEPYIDEQTMRVHHGKHHAAYVKNLNDALEKHPELASKTIEELMAGVSNVPSDIQTIVRNHGGGHYNHALFWPSLAPKGQGGKIGNELNDAFDRELGGFGRFEEKFTKAATGVFGSGWAWLCLNSEGSLCVCATANQDNPLMKGIVERTGTPLLGLDVWEHAYYLKYQNRRPEYIDAWWNIINWKVVSERYVKAREALQVSAGH